MSNEKSIGEMIEASAPTAPRITPNALQANISSVHYFTASDGVIGAKLDDLIDGDAFAVANGDKLALLTICVLVLQNGFTVTGESACASPENFNAEIGQRIARKNAEEKIWPLMGYQLKEQLYQATQPSHSPE